VQQGSHYVCSIFSSKIGSIITDSNSRETVVAHGVEKVGAIVSMIVKQVINKLSFIHQAPPRGRTKQVLQECPHHKGAGPIEE